MKDIKVNKNNPREYEKLQSEIENARNFHEYLDNWDGMESKGYKHFTWQRANDLLQKYFEYMSQHADRIPIPKVRPGVNGSFDVLWRSFRFDLLVNIPESKKAFMTAYGEDKSGKNSVELPSLDENSSLSLFKWIALH